MLSLLHTYVAQSHRREHLDSILCRLVACLIASDAADAQKLHMRIVPCDQGRSSGGNSLG